MAIITSVEEIKKLRQSGVIAHQALIKTAAAVKPGVSTAELNTIAEEIIITAGGRPAFKGYQGFPSALCTSINQEVVHGIPSVQRIVKEGDIIGLDVGVEFQGLYSDHALTLAVGKVPDSTLRLIDDTKKALTIGIKQIKPGRHIGDISWAIEQFLKPRGYGIVYQLTGHGLGYEIHEPPAVPNHGRAGSGPVLVEGQVLAIEPMVTLGQPEVEVGSDGWTMSTADHSLAAHFEHTIIVTRRGSQIITK